MSHGEDDTNPYRAPRLSPTNDNWHPPTVDMSRAIGTAGTYSREDCLAAIRLRDDSTPKTWLQWLIFSGGCAAFGLATFGALRLASVDWLLTALISVAAVVLLLAIAFMMPHFYAWIAWRRWADQVIRRWVSDDAIRTDMLRVSVTESWSLYRVHMRSDNLALLWATDFSTYCLYPRSHFATDADWHKFVSLLDRKLERRFRLSAFGDMRRYSAVLSSHSGTVPRS